MQFNGDHLIQAPCATVWNALDDPAMLRAIVPDCDEVVRAGAHRFEGRVRAVIGPLKMRFGGRMSLADIDAPRGCTLEIEGGGGGAGMVRAAARVSFAEEEGATRLSYAVEFVTGGALAQLADAVVLAAVEARTQECLRRLSIRLTGHMGDVAENLLTGEIDQAVLEAAATPPSAEPVLAEFAAAEMPDSVDSLAVTAAEEAIAAMPVPPIETIASHGLPPQLWIPALVALVGLVLVVFVGHGG